MTGSLGQAPECRSVEALYSETTNRLFIAFCTVSLHIWLLFFKNYQNFSGLLLLGKHN